MQTKVWNHLTLDIFSTRHKIHNLRRIKITYGRPANKTYILVFALFTCELFRCILLYYFYVVKKPHSIKRKKSNLKECKSDLQMQFQYLYTF